MRQEHGDAGEIAGRLHQIVDGALDAFVLMDARGIVRSWNRAAEHLFGWSSAEALGRRLSELIVPARHRDAHRGWAERGEFDETLPFLGERTETEALHHQGHEILVERRVILIRDPFGATLGLFFRDLTARRSSHAEDALRRSEASFRQLIEQLPDGVLVHREGRLVYANPAALKMLGYASVEALVGCRMLDLVHPDDHVGVSQRIEEIVTSGTPAVFHEERLVRRDGTILPAEVTGLPVTFDGKAAMAKLVHDVTEKRQMHAQLAQADRLASMGLLAASVAHEVNNPLAYVLLNLERLTKELPDLGAAFASLREQLVDTLGEEHTASLFRSTRAARAETTVEALLERVKTATEGARHVGRIARDLKAFARVEDNERGLVDINALMDKVIDIAANELRFRAIVVREYGELPSVAVNEGRLSQVFLNLLLNAAHAIDEGPPENNVVHVSTHADGDHVRIEVADSGRGIPREHLPRLFEPFFTTKAKGQGSGLGLSICRDIVHAHGGRIEVESEPWCGSLFTVHLPVGTASPRTPVVPPNARAAIAEGARLPRLLVVDDEQTLRTTLAVMLGDDFQVVLADSGAAVFELLSRDRDYDVILCDLMMPEISGMQVHAWLGREAPELLPRTLFMTGGAFTRNASEFLEHVPNGYIEKPFEVQDLIHALVGVIDKWKSEPAAARDAAPVR